MSHSSYQVDTSEEYSKIVANNAMKDQVEGKAHEIKGAVTGNKREEVGGKLQGTKGNVERKVGGSPSKGGK